MKHCQKLVLAALLLAGLVLGTVGCVGYVDDGPGYYRQDHWYHDGPWMDGPRGYIGIDVHPGRPFHR